MGWPWPFFAVTWKVRFGSEADAGSHQSLRSSSSLRRPAIRLGAGAAHQHRPFAVAQAGGLAEGLDGLLVVDDRESAGPVGAPQAALEAPGVEQAAERIPDVREGIRLLRQR